MPKKKLFGGKKIKGVKGRTQLPPEFGAKKKPKKTAKKRGKK